MNTNLTQYLSDVFRNEVQEKPPLDSGEVKPKIAYLNDRKTYQFLIDGKYALRLDEII